MTKRSRRRSCCVRSKRATSTSGTVVAVARPSVVRTPASSPCADGRPTAAASSPIRDSPTYVANPNSITTPAVGLPAAVVREPLQFAPGTQGSYSSTNYLVLGLLLEDLSGKPFEQLLRGKLITQPLGLESAVLTPSLPPPPNFSTGGLLMGHRRPVGVDVRPLP